MIALLACVAPGIPLAPAADTSAAPEALPAVEPDLPDDPTAALFDVDRIATLALTMDAADWLAIRDNPWAETWHAADFSWDGETVEQIAVRAFGQGSEIAGKPGLKLKFDGLVPGQEFRGLDELKLDNSSQDVGYLNERIATGIMRRFGVPAARTGWADVTVNGDAVGFFVVLESIDDRFVERWFGDDDGVLYGMNSGYYGQGLNPMSEGLTWYEPQTSVQSDGSDLVAVANAVADGSDAELAEVLDLDGFLRESVARSVLGSLDAFSADGNNFYLYDDGGRFTIIPWDFDVDLGGYYFTTSLSVDPWAPWDQSPWSANAVTGAEYTDPVLLRQLAMGADVDAVLAELLADAASWPEVDAEVVASAALIHDAVHADVLGYGTSFDQRVPDLRMYLHARLSRLAGRDVADCPDLQGLPASALSPSGTVGWGELLVDETNWGPGFSIAGEHVCTGLFAHAPSDVTLSVPDGKTTLYGQVGLQDWNQRCGDGARFRVEQGGVVLWEGQVVQTYEPAVSLGDIGVEAGEVHLIADPNGEYSCDTAAWVGVGVR